MRLLDYSCCFSSFSSTTSSVAVSTPSATWSPLSSLSLSTVLVAVAGVVVVAVAASVSPLLTLSSAATIGGGALCAASSSEVAREPRVGDVLADDALVGDAWRPRFEPRRRPIYNFRFKIFNSQTGTQNTDYSSVMSIEQQTFWFGRRWRWGARGASRHTTSVDFFVVLRLSHAQLFAVTRRASMCRQMRIQMVQKTANHFRTTLLQ